MKQAKWQGIVQKQYLHPSGLVPTSIIKRRAKRLASGKPILFTGFSNDSHFLRGYFSFCIQCGESVSYIHNGQEQMKVFRLHTCTNTEGLEKEED